MSFDLSFSRESARALPHEVVIDFEEKCIWPAVDDLFRTDFRSVDTRPGRTCIREDRDRTPEGFFKISLVAMCEPICDRPKDWLRRDGYEPWGTTLEIRKKSQDPNVKRSVFNDRKKEVYKDLSDFFGAEERRISIDAIEELGLDYVSLWNCTSFEFGNNRMPVAIDAKEFSDDEEGLLHTIVTPPPKHLSFAGQEGLPGETRCLVGRDIQNIAHALGVLSLPRELVSLAYKFSK